MKHKISVSLDSETLEKIREGVRSGYFRNRSHAIEYSINKVLEVKQDG